MYCMKSVTTEGPIYMIPHGSVVKIVVVVSNRCHADDGQSRHLLKLRPFALCASWTDDAWL
jgi:hypothetical protein